MKKSILNLGSPISRKSQQLIFGGNDQSCTFGSCPEDYTCYQNSGGTFCSDQDQGLSAIAVRPWPIGKKISGGGGGDGGQGGD